MHGSTHYPDLASDQAGYDMKHARNGAKKYAIYIEASDHVPSDYNGGLPTGSAVIGLLLTKRTVGPGAYELYHLGTKAYNQPSQAAYAGHNDAIAIHDQLLWLLLGGCFLKLCADRR